MSIVVNYMCMRTLLGAEANWHDAARTSGSNLLAPEESVACKLFIGNEIA